MPDGGLTITSFVNVRQEVDKPFIKFPDKLKAALGKQIDNITIQEILLKHLAVESTNPDCQKVVRPLWASTVTEMLKEGLSENQHCNNFASWGSCYDKCLLWIKSLLFLQEAGSYEMLVPPEQWRFWRTRHICSCCRRWQHYVKQCQSKFPKGGKLLPAISMGPSGNHQQSIEGNFCMDGKSSPTALIPANALKAHTAGSARMDLASTITITVI